LTDTIKHADEHKDDRKQYFLKNGIIIAAAMAATALGAFGPSIKGHRIFKGLQENEALDQILHHQKEAVDHFINKTYTIMGQAFALAVEENGDPTGWSLTNNAAGHGNLLNLLAPYLKTLKVCGAGTGCWYDEYWTQLDGRVSTNNGKIDSNSNASARLQLVDGTLMALVVRSADCTYRGDECGNINVDINGMKGPNQIGRDVFWFYIKKDKILPFGFSGDEAYPFTESCNMTSTVANNNGGGCAAWVIYNENMDYLHCNDLSWDGKIKCD
jgi:hypothetical protein